MNDMGANTMVVKKNRRKYSNEHEKVYIAHLQAYK